MRRVNVRKRGKVYQYQFEIGTINGKRKFINKSGFKTQNEAYAAGQLAYEKYINGGVTFKQSQMLYSDYLDYWMKEYFEINYKYTTAKRYSEAFETIKKEMGKYKLAYLTACYTGMRTGEVLALTWDDIDLEKQIIKVNKTVYAKKSDETGRWYLSTTKTEGSCRDVYVCDTLKIALQNYKKNQESNKKLYRKNYHNYYLEEIKNKYGKIVEYKIIELKHKSKNRKQVSLVFTKNDERYSGTDLLRYPFKIIHEELNIKNCRFYDLRGSFATKTLRSRIELKDVSSILGHAKVETTENYYIISNEETKKNACIEFERNIQSDIINIIVKFL